MPSSSTATLQPIPTLRQYYAAESEKKKFVRQVFDDGAEDYDRVEKIMGLGTGSWYRRQALMRAGLRSGMRVLDVAVGTGLVAREAATVVGGPQLILGIDPSIGMLSRAVAALGIRAAMGIGERLPVADQTADFLSMGYALRHLTDLSTTFAEFYRALKPGGTVCILELTRPSGRFKMLLLKLYMRVLIPAMTRLTARRGHNSHKLWVYYWDTIVACVPPETVMDALKKAGFTDLSRHVELGLFSEYVGRRPFDELRAGL
jgi:demethylmenaquinone methyltransferase/2-methoxy-6-polyprenyl-1,4-benzoquinol methylase